MPQIAVISMLTGVVACPAMMFGTAPDDDTIARGRCGSEAVDVHWQNTTNVGAAA
jgi:hypothetical protein